MGIAHRIRASLRHRGWRRSWEQRWGKDDFLPRFRLDEIPPEIESAVREAWFPPGSTVLDIGCGDGWISAWLARQGHSVLGVDFSSAAIERAVASHGSDPERLRWQVRDIVRDHITGRFDVLIDRGCFSHIAGELLPAYARRVREVTGPGARFLLTMAPLSIGEEDEAFRRVEDTLVPAFHVERRETSVIELVGDRDPEGEQESRVGGLTVWLTRR